MTEDLPLTYELADNSDFQIDDDLSLLNLMVSDMGSQGLCINQLNIGRSIPIK